MKPPSASASGGRRIRGDIIWSDLALPAGAWGLTRAPGVDDLMACVGSVRSPAGQPSWVCSVKAFAAD
jgi:hypothetical protein